MNYIKQLNAFYKIAPVKQISANAKNLYETLLYVNSSCFWITDFTAANLYLMSLTSLSKQSIYRARNELIQKELIKFKKGINQNEAGKYKIIEFVTADDIPNEFVIPNNTPNNTADDTPNDTPNDTAGDTINKQNKTKQNNKKNIYKKKYGKYKNVLLKDNELEKLKNDYSNWEQLIDFLDEYIERKGYKANSHYLCIKKWVVDAVKQENIKKSKEKLKNQGNYEQRQYDNLDFLYANFKEGEV